MGDLMAWTEPLARYAELRMQRAADFVIGAPRRYMERWFVVPRNPAGNAYLHRFWRSDDDQALHDHPWPSVSIVLRGGYVEHTIAAGGIHRRRIRRPGDVIFRGPQAAHRIEIDPTLAGPGEVVTLFLTGPRIREWGFHCPKGWVHWRDFTSADGRTVDQGCGEA
ncbi:MAG TPA: hypothetical protein VFB02_13755 [Bradyrhizobium sp.]|nr:hypothetical protein [Bradyrhizobium sp.]